MNFLGELCRFGVFLQPGAENQCADGIGLLKAFRISAEREAFQFGIRIKTGIKEIRTVASPFSIYPQAS